MVHHTLKSSYARQTERLNRFPRGAPPSELLFRILRMLFSEQEAERIALLPIKPFPAEKAARIWKIPSTRAGEGVSLLGSGVGIRSRANWWAVFRDVFP